MTEESDSDADDRNLTREDIEQVIVEAVVIIRATDPARLEGIPAKQGAGIQTQQEQSSGETQPGAPQTQQGGGEEEEGKTENKKKEANLGANGNERLG